MLIKTKGIVFRTIKYSESSVIAHIFTEEKGLMSYILSGVRKPKSKTQASLLLPLSIVEMVAYHSDRSKLHRIREIKPAYLFTSIPFDMRKASICLFLSELCSKTVKGTESNPSLFQFLQQQIISLDMAKENFLSAHLFFMIGFAGNMGFALEPPKDQETSFFDLMHGNFIREKPSHPYWTGNVSSLIKLINKDRTWHCSRQERNALLDDLITYFRLHIDGMRELNSHKILREIL